LISFWQNSTLPKKPGGTTFGLQTKWPGGQRLLMLKAMGKWIYFLIFKKTENENTKNEPCKYAR
jgi:hypothetical protein